MGMEKNLPKHGLASPDRFQSFFELVRLPPDPRVEKVLNGAVTHVPVGCQGAAAALKRLLEWKRHFNVLVVDPAGGPSSTGRVAIVLDENYRPLPGVDVRSNTGELGKTDEHGRFPLHQSWNRFGLVLVQGEKRGDFTIDGPPVTVDDPGDQVFLNILTDLDQYRPAQPIHVRCIVWAVSGGKLAPVGGATAVASLVNAECIEVVRHRLATDGFGVLDLVIDTDHMIREGAYTLRFDFPEYKHVVQKPITIKNFTPPMLVLEAPASIDVERGKDIEIPVLLRYYYGDPVTRSECSATVSSEVGEVAKHDFCTRNDGTATARFPASALPTGTYEAHVVGKDGAGRVASAIVKLTVWEPAGQESQDASPTTPHLPGLDGSTSPSWAFEASIDARDPGRCNISFSVEDPGSTWFSRPAFIFWSSSGRVMAHDVLYPARSAVQPICVPPDASGPVTVTVLRIEQNGQYTTRDQRMFVHSRDRRIAIHIEGAEEARPGARVSLGVHVDPPHDRKPLELGAMLVDGAVRGKGVAPPFSEICDQPRVAIRLNDTWTSSYSNLLKDLDRFLADTIKHIDQYSFNDLFTSGDVLHLVKFLERSNFCSEYFIEHHVTSLCCTFGKQPPEAVTSFILEYLRWGYEDVVDLGKLLAWSPTLMATWRHLLQPEDPTSEQIESEFPGTLAKILSSSKNEFRDLQRYNDPSDFASFYGFPNAGVYVQAEIEAAVNAIDRCLAERFGIVVPVVVGLPPSEGYSAGAGSYDREIQRQAQPHRKAVIPPAPVSPESTICIDGLSDWLLCDEITEKPPRVVLPVIVGYPKYTSVMVDVSHEPPAPDPFRGAGSEPGPVVTVRTHFPDCGYWNPRILVEGGEASVSLKLPDTITRQDFIVQATSMECDAGMATKPILVRQEFFIVPDIPPHLVYGDIMEISAVITNRTAQDMAFDASLDAEGFRIDVAPPGGRVVAANGILKVAWTLQATSCGEKHLVITASSKSYKDVVERIVFVHPEGEPIIKIRRGAIRAGADGRETLEVDVTPGEIAHYAHLSIIPDRSSLALDGLEAMLSYPHGCVEQTMSSVLPNLLVYESLSALGRLSPRFQARCEDMISKGLQRLLSFRHDDTGWGWWERDSTNLFMTGYVLRGLLKMKALGLHAPQGVIDQAFDFISRKQQADGSWLVEQALQWDRVHGGHGLPLNDAGMTAWLLSCISETGDWKACFTREVEKGLSFLEGALGTIENDPNALATAGLAIHRLAPARTCLGVIQRLIEATRMGSYWETGSALGGDVDSTAKALHFLIRHQAGTSNQAVPGCVDWLLGKRLAAGGWGTTMGTASVVEAVLALRQDMPPQIDGDITVNGHVRSIHVDSSNMAEAFVNLRDMNITPFLNPGKNDVDMRVSSKLDVQYQISEAVWTPDHSPGSTGFTIERSHSCNETRPGETITVSVRVAASEGVDRCAVIEEPIPAGFKLDIEAFEASMRGNGEFEHFICTPERITLYPRSANCAFTYSIVASRVFTGTHTGTVVYAMYNPGMKCTSFPAPLEVRKI